MRLFIAINIDEMILDKINNMIKNLESFSSSKDIKWVAKENIHLTLKFIGEYKKENLNNLIKVLNKIKSEKINLTVKKLGFFGNLSNPRILWAGLEEENKNTKLNLLAKTIDKSLVPLGIQQEKRDFKPHLTLARVKTKINENIKNFFINNKDIEFGSFFVDEFILYESILKSSGPEYKIIEKFKF